MNIRDIILIITIIYVFYLHSKINNIKKIENFALSTDDKNEVRTLIKEIYNTDMDAIRTLAKMADDIQKTGLQVNGNLIVTGTIKSTGAITSNGEIKTLDTNNNEKASLNTVNSNTNSNSSSINSLSSSTSTATSNITAITKRKTARYIRVGNKDSDIKKDHWTLVKLKAFNMNGTDVALNRSVSVIEGGCYHGSNANNITSSTAYWQSGDNYQNGCHGTTGTTLLQVDLGSEHVLNDIQLFNRWHGEVDMRMDGTTIELIGNDGVVNRIINTGLWHRQYSKEFTI